MNRRHDRATIAQGRLSGGDLDSSALVAASKDLVLRVLTLEERVEFLESHLREIAAPEATLPKVFTTSEAARYLRFRSTAAVRKARLERRLMSLGRRGGKGPWMFSREALDDFVDGGRPHGDIIVGERSDVPLSAGGTDGNDMGETLEIQNRAGTQQTRGVARERRRIPGSGSSHGLSDGKTERSDEDGPRHRRGGGVQGAAGGTRKGQERAGQDCGGESALRRIRRVAFREKGRQR